MIRLFSISLALGVICVLLGSGGCVTTPADVRQAGNRARQLSSEPGAPADLAQEAKGAADAADQAAASYEAAEKQLADFDQKPYAEGAAFERWRLKEALNHAEDRAIDAENRARMASDRLRKAMAKGKDAEAQPAFPPPTVSVGQDFPNVQHQLHGGGGGGGGGGHPFNPQREPGDPYDP